MKSTNLLIVLTAILLPVAFGPNAIADDETASQAGEQVGVEGQFVRLAENSEGYVIVGRRTANESVNEEWMLLDVHFADSIVKVPMKIMTKDEAKAFEEQWKAQLKASRHKGK